jgi:membrane protein implicated in regulation of membrane protease activity
MEKGWKLFTLTFLVGFFSYVGYSLSPYYNFIGSLVMVAFFVVLLIILLRRVVKEGWYSESSAERLIKEEASPSLKKESVLSRN